METEESKFHPSSTIIKSFSDTLKDKCIILAVTASISLYRSLDTARWLMRRGAKVKVIMSEEASNLISPDMFYWATGIKPVVKLTGATEHISLTRECDAMLIAPATFSSMSKIAYGITDNPVSLTAITFMGYNKPIILVPAMHEKMENTKQYEEIEKRLIQSYVFIISPYVAEEVAKYPDPQFVARVTGSHMLRRYDMKGLKLLITAGATRAWIDDVRFITNPSSGRMGIELSIEAYSRGAEVDLVHGHTEVQIPHTVNSYHVDTTEEMANKIAELTSKNNYDIIIGAAAPLDFDVEKFEGKMRSELSYNINLTPAKKTLKSIYKRPKVLISFAAESIKSDEELIEKAKEKIAKYNSDIVVANPANLSGIGFSSLYDKAVLIFKNGKIISVEKTLKENLARVILDSALNLIRGG
ncbi:MAG: bifunctional phosphopantothenoylcysteine decarboxylase/phosphopantothenate--cysteine ligase CoaBC [Caldisphaera sp.]|uniref:bifunctional phosphopantothenoylcysteine decarboxylase/phosphopantothenate--cysteine ligase CoaBC n=1 Tax=Caldisphaera sp. TaxID=2060322 RepID=UPI003D0F7FB6